ncbi:MAG: hypothetical protein R3B07_34425 [Polyangiaceae bacterium]
MLREGGVFLSLLGLLSFGCGERTPASAEVEFQPSSARTTFTLGYSHKCALRRTGKVACWGTASAALGINSQDDFSTPRDVEGIPTDDWHAISAGAYGTCGLTELGDVWCWGASFDGTELPGAREIVSLHGRVEQISAGFSHVCALVRGGDIECWGYNEMGEAGPDKLKTVEPTRIEGLGQPMIQVSAGTHFSCGLTAVHSVYCWGTNVHGELLREGQSSSVLPVRIELQGEVKALGVSHGQSMCVVMRDETLRCWGTRMYPILHPEGDAARVLGLSHALSVSSGADESCAVLPGGSVWCWDEPTQTEALSKPTDVSELASGEYEFCGRRGDELWCWTRAHQPERIDL